MIEIKHPAQFIAHLLVILGAINWLAVGLFNYDIVDKSAGKHSNVIYTILGLAGVFLAVHMGMILAGMHKA